MTAWFRTVIGVVVVVFVGGIHVYVALKNSSDHDDSDGGGRPW